jgi:tRNA-2-methylthio-N6-dimethylallyladenosine synthase
MEYENKVIDEALQGTALDLPAQGNSDAKKLYLESYGCQMNFSDSEVVASILSDQGYQTTRNIDDADVILLNTCSIRENAEQRVRNRLTEFKIKKERNPELVVGILGCMAERLKKNLLEEEKLVDLVAGPDAYRDLPNLIDEVGTGQKAVNVLLSRDETYADISPVRLDQGGISAFVTIMRGCDNMCSFCVVPFTRGRERSRDPQTIVAECRDLFEKGYREVTLLGQNVDSYRWNISAKGEIKNANEPTTNFAQLMEILHSPSCAVWTYRRALPHEPRLFSRVVPRSHCRDQTHHSGLRYFYGYHYRFLWRNRRRASRYPQLNGFSTLRFCLHVQIFRTAKNTCRTPFYRRYPRRSERSSPQ